MQTKILSFNKIERHTVNIQDTVNEYLQGKTLRLACVSESHTKGKLYLTLFTVPGKGDVKVKVFRDVNPKRVNEQVNEFAKAVDFKFATQCSSTGHLSLFVFYSEREELNQDPTPVDPEITSTDTNPASSGTDDNAEENREG